MDANSEIERLRQRLRFKGFTDKVIDAICDDAAREINSRTTDILTDAMNEAVNVGGDMISAEFIQELRAQRIGSSFRITTDSGNMDFSEPPFPMLPSLLKNAKVAKDGSLYKVIPIKQKSALGDSKMAKTTESALRNIDMARQVAKNDTDSNNVSHGSPSAMKGMDTIAAMQALNKARSVGVKEKSHEPTINFRTASSKQDPSRQWVRPGKTKDATDAMSRINNSLQDKIDSTIDDVIRKFEGLY